MTVKLSIVRHGESTDNLGSVWAGFKDAPLSNHGMNQAKAVGKAFKEAKLDGVYASPLLRARWTAEQIHSQNSTPSLGPITFTPLVKEQNFGKAEGQSWEKGGFVRGQGRQFRFDEGESLEDVGRRADEAIDKFILPHVVEAARTGEDRHIVLVAHGIFNSELVGALLRRRTNDRSLAKNEARTGPMTNTGFHHVLLHLATDRSTDDNPPALDVDGKPDLASPSNPSSDPPALAPVTPSSSSGSSPAPPSSDEVDKKPRLKVQLTTINSTVHLDNVKRQPGGIGSSAFDSKQQSMRDFISGGGQAKV